MQFNIPTLITIFRIILIPFFILTFYCNTLASAIIFIIAAITDYIDGFLARKLKKITIFGAFLDPVADKIMIVISLILIIEDFHIWWITFPSSTMIIREIIVSALREWMAKIGQSKKVSVSFIGKIKTTIQIVSVFSLLWKPNLIVEVIGIITLYTATVITYWSMMYYFKSAIKVYIK